MPGCLAAGSGNNPHQIHFSLNGTFDYCVALQVDNWKTARLRLDLRYYRPDSGIADRRRAFPEEGIAAIVPLTSVATHGPVIRAARKLAFSDRLM